MRRIRTLSFSWRALLAPCLGVLVVGGLAAPVGSAEPRGDARARGPADVYERTRSSLEDVLVLVARDLRTRAEQGLRDRGPGARPESTRGTLVLVVDPTRSMEDEMRELTAALSVADGEGCATMRYGVLGAGVEDACGLGTLAAARDAVSVLRIAPLDGPKNLLGAVRDALACVPLGRPSPGEARAVVLVTEEGGDGEDDVEETRRALEERGFAFHSIAPEAAFERAWAYDFVARTAPDLGLSQRFSPNPRRAAKGELFYGGESAFGLVPYKWELPSSPFAQTEFAWPGGGQFPVPSGFGFWCLATLSASSGGRCFVYNFRAPGARSRDKDRTLSVYDFGFLNLLAPDLRPRADVLRALEADRRALSIVKVWDMISAEEAPLVLDHGTLERTGRGISVRPMLPVRSSTDFALEYGSADDWKRARAIALERRKRAEAALDLWAAEAARPLTGAPPTDPLNRRVEADFDLLGFQLTKVRFHWGEAIAALDTIEPEILDGRRRARLSTHAIAVGTAAPPRRSGSPTGDERRDAALAEVLALGHRLVTRYHDTPWALVVERGYAFTFVARVIEPRPPPTAKPAAPEAPKGKPTKPAPPPPPRKPAPPPPPPPRPNSGGSGETTGGGASGK